MSLLERGLPQSLGMCAVIIAILCADGLLAAQTGTPAAQRVQPASAFEKAVAGGTRTGTGNPGRAYWQQRVDYLIRAALDTESGRVHGSERILYHNRSPDSLDRIVLHIDQNVYAPGARRNRRVPVTGGAEIHRITIDGNNVPVRYYNQQSRYYMAATLLDLPLPDGLAPGDSMVLEVTWEFTVPPAPTFRNGNLDGQVFAVAQWYPRVAVYDDVYGWDTSPYLGDGEFYLEYGNFDVWLSLPPEWLVAASGELRNPEQVLRAPVLDRYRQVPSEGTVTHVVRRGDIGRTTQSDSTGRVLWHFTASNVRDFAFSTSNRYLWDRSSTGPVVVNAFYRPGFPAWSRATEYESNAIGRLSKQLGAYPYQQITAAEGPVGGMEYPMLVFIAGGANARGLLGVLTHEIAHQWFPMVVGSMEAKHAWMDEGFVSYFTPLITADFLHERPPSWGANEAYLMVAGSEGEVPLMRHTDLVNPYGARTLAAYTKPAVVLGALEEVVGPDVLAAAFRDYFGTWSFKHPQPWDFFNLIERHAQRDLDWFWRPLFFETATFDQEIAAVGVEDTRTEVEIRNLGGVILPALVSARLEDGSTWSGKVEVDHWLTGERSVLIEIPGRAVEIQLDPDRKFPDINRSNNHWRRQAR